MVIFGATGDLTARKLVPALLTMYREKQLGRKFYIVGVGRREMDNEGFRQYISEKIDISQELWSEFSQNIYYQKGLFEDKALYDDLVTLLHSFDQKEGESLPRYFYLATPPKNYSVVLENLGSTGLADQTKKDGNGVSKILIEKPFGKDAYDAIQLEKILSKTFEEKQIYRIDHYLGKEAIQNIIAFRFANGIFEPIWNKDYVDSVQITMAESSGLQNRIGFYEGIGALRDVMQNHMLAMMALVAMEQPKDFSPESVRNARFNALSAIEVMDVEEVKNRVVRGQYTGELVPEHEQKPVNSYREEKGVEKHSETDTFVAMKLFVDSERWKGVPFYLRTGKRLKKDVAEISIVFKQTCHILFREVGCPEEGNILTLRVSPDEGIGVRVVIKKPGHEFKLKTTDLHFRYKEDLSEDRVVEAYERILEEVFRGDQMLFNRSDEMESAWKIITPILTAWQNTDGVNALRFYPSFSWGPKEAQRLLEKDGKKWVLR